MYADAELFYPYFQNFSEDVHQIHLLQLCHSHQSHSPMSSAISEYDMGGEGDLFKAAETIILEEPVMSIDPMTAAISMMSCVEHVMPTTQEDTFPNDQLFGDISYDQCSKKDDVLESDPKDIAAAAIMPHEMQIEDSLSYMDPGFPKSVSSGCLRSMDWINASAMKPSILELDFGGAAAAAAAYGMRRAFSDGDIKALGNGDTRSLVHPPIQQQQPPVAVVGSCTSEDRLQKLSRYRNKKSKRNFGRKIKYACRKALADSQPRIRGRFAKTQETELLKRQ